MCKQVVRSSGLVLTAMLLILGGSFAVQGSPGTPGLMESTAHVSEPAPSFTAAPGVGAPPAYQAESWKYLGGPLGGLGYDVRMDPRNSDFMYVTDAFAGVFKSTNGAISWFPSNQGIPAEKGAAGDGIPVFCLTVDPNNPDRLWAGGENNSGVYRSDDLGANWETYNAGVFEEFLTVRGFTVEPGNSNVVYFAAEVPSFEWNGFPRSGMGLDMTRGVVYKTTDAGEHWERIWEGENLTRYIWIHPQHHNNLYASTGIFDREAANSDILTLEPGGVGILRSDDGGANWEVLNEANGLDADELYFGSLSMHPHTPNVLVAGAGNDPYSLPLARPLGGVYITRDGGDSWIEAVDGHNFSAVEICQDHPDVWYAGALSGFFRSTDNGTTWLQTGAKNWGPPGIVAGFPIDIECDPDDPIRIFVNAYGGGNFLSTDGGVTWTVASQGYTGALMRQISIDPSYPARVFAAARSGVFYSPNAGDQWKGLNYGPAHFLEGIAVSVDPHNASHLLASIGDAGPEPLLSWDRGYTWEKVNAGIIPPNEAGNAMLNFYFLPSDPPWVLAAVGDPGCTMGYVCDGVPGLGMIRSENGGKDWQPTNLPAGVPTDVAWGWNHDSLLVYTNVYGYGLFRSMDAGATWTLVNSNPLPSSMTPTPDVFLFSLAVNPFNPMMLYGGVVSGAVIISEDGGSTWVSSGAGMAAEAAVVSIVTDPVRPGVAYAATFNQGVFYTLNGGETWIPLNDGLLNRSMHDLAISADGSLLYASTEGAGLFRLGKVVFPLYLPYLQK